MKAIVIRSGIKGGLSRGRDRKSLVDLESKIERCKESHWRVKQRRTWSTRMQRRRSVAIW